MSRPARAQVDAAALRHNLQQVRSRAPRTRIMAVVKADGYGHGLAWVARTLSDHVDAFGVSSMEEGIQLREAGIAHPICLLEGFFSADELPLLAKHKLDPAIHEEGQLKALEHASPSLKLSVWLKIDTGMHRLGFAPASVADTLKRLRGSSAVAQVRLMSHFARADIPSDPIPNPNSIASSPAPLVSILNRASPTLPAFSPGPRAISTGCVPASCFTAPRR